MAPGSRWNWIRFLVTASAAVLFAEQGSDERSRVLLGRGRGDSRLVAARFLDRNHHLLRVRNWQDSLGLGALDRGLFLIFRCRLATTAATATAANPLDDAGVRRHFLRDWDFDQQAAGL